MKKIIYLALIMLFVIILGACAKATQQSANEMINPGDKIGDFLITTGEGEDVTYGFDLDCTKQVDKENYSCKAMVGTKVNVATGIYDGTHSGKLDERWSSYNIELFIDNHPANLKAFGSIDVKHSLVGMIRYWNLVIIANKPGEITIHETGVYEGKPIDSTTTYTFSK